MGGEQKPARPKQFVLPNIITGRTEVGRLLREMNEIDDYMVQQEVKQTSQPASLPVLSRLLNEVVQTNDLTLLDKATREALRKNLTIIRDKAPLIHISFAVDPPTNFIHKIVKWLREEIHPLTLVQIGLQPGIAVGCIVRTTNHYFDLSLRESFKSQRPMLLKAIGGESG